MPFFGQKTKARLEAQKFSANDKFQSYSVLCLVKRSRARSLSDFSMSCIIGSHNCLWLSIAEAERLNHIVLFCSSTLHWLQGRSARSLTCQRSWSFCSQRLFGWNSCALDDSQSQIGIKRRHRGVRRHNYGGCTYSWLELGFSDSLGRHITVATHSSRLACSCECHWGSVQQFGSACMCALNLSQEFLLASGALHLLCSLDTLHVLSVQNNVWSAHNERAQSSKQHVVRA